jgi:uncharacterized protein
MDYSLIGTSLRMVDDMNHSTPRKLFLSGASGLIGRGLISRLRDSGREVVPMVRQSNAPAGAISWDPLAAHMDPSLLQGADAVIHLSGENLASGRWTAARKARFWESRVRSTELLARTIAQLSPPPRHFICASATGFYGNRGDEELTESSAAGSGFIADLCQHWERASAPAAAAGVRVVHLRFGVVLSAAGGALAKMLPLFKFGLGGSIGNGRQYFGWITLDDALAAILHLLDFSELAGPVNLVAPQAVTYREFAKTLGRVLHRPAFFNLPAMAARLLIGEMADQVLLASARVVPQRLQEDGFTFAQPDLESALRQLLGRVTPSLSI